MNILKKLKWRIEYVKKNGFHAVSLVLPGKIRSLFYGQYSFLSWLATQDKELKIKKEKDGYLITFRNFKFLIPSKGFAETDFLDIIYPPEKNNWLEGFLPVDVLDGKEGPYEINEAFIKQNDVVIDAEANIGLFSVSAAKKVGKGGKIYAFEPISEIAKFLSNNILLNNCTNIFINELALGKTTGSIEFSVNLKKVLEVLLLL